MSRIKKVEDWTDEELEAFAKAHPDLEWPKNELKYRHVSTGPCAGGIGGVGACDAAVECERRYNGGYVE